MLPKLSNEQTLIMNACKFVLVDSGFPYRIGLAQMCAESRFNKDIVSKAGAVGVAQFMPATFEEVAKELRNKGIIIKSRNDVKDSVLAYVHYMTVSLPRQLKNLGYRVSWENLWRSYNAGAGNLKRSFSIPETNGYVKTINEYLKVF